LLINVDQRETFLAALQSGQSPASQLEVSLAAGRHNKQVYTPQTTWKTRPGEEIAIRIEQLTRRFRNLTVVDHLSLNIRRGEIYGFLGSNGAGKTTSIKMLVGLLQPDEGHAWMTGYDVWEEPSATKRDVRNISGYVPDRSLLYERLTGHELLAFLGQVRGLPETEMQERLATLLDLRIALNADFSNLAFEVKMTIDAQDGFGQTPLHWAAGRAHADVVSLLLSYNVDVHICDQRGETPLFLAVGNKRSRNTIQLLLEAGADVNAQASYNGFTPLHEAIWRARSVEHEDIIQLLLDSGADVYTRDLQGRTPFHTAKGKPQLLVLLSEHMEKAGPPPALTSEQFVVEEIELHPHKREAVTLVKDALLARWVLDNPPRLLASITTTYSRFNALAVSPDGETVALAPAQEPVELRRWDDFSLLPPGGIPISDEATSLAFSPDERWLALADRQEAIYVIDRTNGKVTAKTEGGEWTSALLFDPGSTLLASACSFQGGGYVRLDKLSNEGQLTTLHELQRSDYKTPANVFVDSLIDLAFSPDGRWLAWKYCALPCRDRSVAMAGIH
jgi:hypothetical protein